MRLGAASLCEEYHSPEEWIALVRKRGYQAVVTPVSESASDEEIRAYREAAAHNGLVIAEVGIWKGTNSDDEGLRKQNMAIAKAKLHLADKLGARCAVNIIGERSKRGGPDDLTDEAFNRAVEVIRSIIDEVQPMHTYYCLETMPYMLPDSIELYLELYKAIDRPRFGVHCDPANFMNSPRNYHNNAGMIRQFFKVLGPFICSCHAKDVLLDSTLLVRFPEVPVGKGGLDYPTYVAEINRLDASLPLIIEHLKTEEEYREAAQYLWHVEKEVDGRGT
jgi:sugar phosphate isomerase/epimerase